MNKQRIQRVLSRIPVVLVMIYILLPVVLVVWMSFFSSKMIIFPPKGYSIEWYLNLFSKRNFVSAAQLSVQVAVIATIISVTIGTLTSIGLNQRRFRGRELVQTSFLAPLTIPTIVTGIAIYATLTTIGQWVNQKLVPSMFVLIMGHVIITIPWAIRLINSGMSGIDRRLEEAALNLGANRVQAYLLVVLPQIKSSIMAAGIFTFIVSFNNLEMSLMLVGPGQSMLPIETLNYVLWNMDPTIAAISTLQVVMVLLLLLIVNKLVGLSNVF